MHIEKEAVAIIFGIKKFQQYIFDRKFVMVTDHQPLISLFAFDKAVPDIGSKTSKMRYFDMLHIYFAMFTRRV